MELTKKFLMEFGFDEKQAEKIIKSFINNQWKDETAQKNCFNNCEYFLNKGYSKDEIKKMAKNLVTLLAYSIDNLTQKEKDFLNLGYSEEDFKKIIITFPSIYSYSIDSIKKRIIDLQALGFTEKDIKKITVSTPNIFGYSLKKINQKIDDLMALGYTKEEVLRMLRDCPVLFGLLIDNIVEKIKYLNKIGYGNIVVNNAMKLIQSNKITYARYEFLKEIGFEFGEGDWYILFISTKKFNKRFGVDQKELVKKYNYDEYKNRKE